MAELLMTGAADAREEAYRLLAQRAPAQVLMDPGMPVGTWVIVRGPTEEEQVRARLDERARERKAETGRANMAKLHQRQAAERARAQEAAQ